MVVVIAALVTGCSAAGEAAPARESTISIGGATVRFDGLGCVRSQSYLSILAGRAGAEVAVMLDTSGVKPEVDWIKLRNVNGLSGDVWRGGVGRARAVRRDGREYVVTGSAYGFSAASPTDLGIPVPFRIDARC
ncbi:hypothetical protein ASG82_01955 [Mycobacterium sp. Soil538]|nr:hypothetical protein ASG82_01955 [Mycobacterium sp. Soil538]